MKVATLPLLFIAASTSLSAAYAQNVDTSAPVVGSLLSRDRSVTVADRVIPGYERVGVTVGPFTVNPEIFAGIFGVDNLYATENNRVSDVAFSLAPSATAVLDIDHTRVTLTGDAQFRVFARRNAENNNIYGTRAVVQRDIGSGVTLGIRAGYRRVAESRSDPGAINTSIRPILYTVAEAGGEATWQSNRIRLQGTGLYSDLGFRDGLLASGVVLPQAYRNRKIIRASGIADYAIDSNIAVRIRANYNVSDYSLVPSSNGIDRSSKRAELLGGVTFEFTDLLRGEIGIGYINQRYSSPVFKDFGGVGGRIQLTYLPSQLTTVTLLASRTVEEAGTPLAPSYLRSAITLSADHELYRNVILSGYVGYEDNKFNQPDRSDMRPSVGVSGRYRVNRALSFIARYDHLDVSSDPRDLGRNLTLNSFSAGVDLGF